MNRKYNLKLDLQFRCNNQIMKFDKFDNNTSDFFIKITNAGELFEVEKAIVVLASIKPSGKVVSQFIEVKNGILYADLKADMKNEAGKYTAQAMLILEDERVVTNTITYEVTESSIISAFIEDAKEQEEYTLLTDILNRLSTIEITEEERIAEENSRNYNEKIRIEAENSRQNIFENKVTEINEKLKELNGSDIGSIITKVNSMDTSLNTLTGNQQQLGTRLDDIENRINTGDGNINLDEYVTKEELNSKGYLTEHQDISGKADKTELHNHTNKTVLDGITSAKVNEWNNKSTFSGSYNDLTNKPAIPTVTNDLTNTLKTNYDKAYTHSQQTHAPSNAQKNSDITKSEIEAKLTGNITTHTHSQYLTEHQDLSNYATKSELHNHSNKSVLDGITSSKVTEWNNKSTFSGNYNSLTNKPTIPTKTSQLTNDSNFLTSVPSEYVTDSELNAKGYLTEHQDISGKLNKNFGAENVGKMLVVGSDGNVITMDIPSGGATGDIIGTVDENNNILLSGNLSDGTYILKYENEDGTYSDVGTLVISTIEPKPEPITGNLFNLETTKLNTRFSTSSLTETTQNGGWLTDYIPLNPLTDHTLYVKNAIMGREPGQAPYPAVNFFDENKNYVGCLKTSGTVSSYKDYTEVISENYTKIKLDTIYTINQAWWTNVKYMRIAGVEDESGTTITKDDIKDVIIKLNEEIK